MNLHAERTGFQTVVLLEGRSQAIKSMFKAAVLIVCADILNQNRTVI